MRFTTIASLSVLAFSASSQAQDDVNAAAGLQEATFWNRCPDKDSLNLGDGLYDCDCSRDGMPWWDWFGKNTCTAVVTQTVSVTATVPWIPNPVTSGCDQNGHCTVTVTVTVTETSGLSTIQTSSIFTSKSLSISSIESQVSSELSRLTSELATATGSDRSSIISEIWRLTSSAASRTSSLSSQTRISIFRTGAAAPLQTAGVALGAFFGGVAVLANF
ncbi:hypothetical protein DHEL01_v211412 [Diaporthe helianthi]|uniref:Uncharacterized protein n=1 Tax=Diaporthe helianthi TaxID=158607 RepID=A0A2P5HIV9_DIAHE|nr:hypothetical protein DHEL01_v211412 [Diaporthe helianthi]